MKEKLCYVAYDVQQEQSLALDTTVLVKKYTVCLYEFTQSYPLLNMSYFPLFFAFYLAS